MDVTHSVNEGSVEVDDEGGDVMFILCFVAGVFVVCGGMLAIYTAGVMVSGADVDAWVTWWQSIWAPACGIVFGIALGSVFARLLNEGLNDPDDNGL
jgi:hypothetical protein